MAMIRLKEGAWLAWRDCRWLFERRSDTMTEWRAQDGSLRHAQLSDRQIASLVCSNEAVLFDGHGRPPPIQIVENGRASAPSGADREEAARKLEYVLAAHAAGLMRSNIPAAEWQTVIDNVYGTAGALWTNLRGPARGSRVSKPSIKSVRRWVADAGVKPRLEKLIPRHRDKGNRLDRIETPIREIIDEKVKEHWLARPAIRFDDLKTHIQTAVAALNACLAPGERRYSLPGDDAISTSIAALPPKMVTRARHGEMAAFLSHGSAEALKEPDAPLDVVELDSTTADLFVVCSETHLPLGRPTIVICIDRRTRMVLGWFCTFEKPSVLSVMQTLRNAIMPKDYVARMNQEAGWNIRHECETFGVMRELKLDRGLENLTTHIRDLAVRVGILRIRTLARKSPWLKGCVERTIRTMSERLLHPARGTSLHNALMKMDYNPAKDAVCTTADLDWALHKYFIDVYPREPRRSLGNARAIDVWRRLTKVHAIDMPGSFEETSHLYGRTETAVPGRHGIRALSMSYFSRELLGFMDNPAFLKALKRNGGRLTFHLDPADIGQIVVELPHEDRHIVVPVASKWRSYATGLSLFAHKKIRAYTTEQARNANEADDLLACKAELLDIMRGSIGKGSIADRQLATRMAGGTTRARAGNDIRTSTAASPPSSSPPVPVLANAADAVTLRVGQSPAPAPDTSATTTPEIDNTPSTSNIHTILPARRKKGFIR